METLNNTKIILNAVYSFLSLTVLAFVFLFTPFNNASAYIVTGQMNGGNITYSSSDNFSVPTYSYYNVNVPVYTPAPSPTPAPTPAPTPTLYSSSTNPKAVAAAPKAIAKAKTPEPAVKEVAVKEAKEEEVTDKYQDLAATAVFGENGFLPSGLVQWLLLAILVLGGTILIRKVYGGSEKYYATPMKHN